MKGEEIRAALANFAGVNRRFTKVAEIGGVTIIDDYGHHPTEIKTTLAALETSWPDRRKLVVFQPHRYSRTQALFDDFTRSFYQSDVLLVLPIYAAGEKRIEGLSGHDLCEGIKAHGHKEVFYSEGKKDVLAHLKENLKPGDVLLTLGAGDVWKVGMDILKALR